MAQRQLADWITTYLEYASSSESPISYHQWTAIGMIASMLQRRVSLPWGYEKLYPNLYIVLVGSSGRTKKGTAMKIGKGILNEAMGTDNKMIVSENITREALIKFIEENQSMIVKADGTNEWQCPVSCFSEELSVFLGRDDIKFLSALTDWYDSPDVWRYKTKNSGDNLIYGMCFNLLGATAPDWMESMIPKEARGGGFTSRIIFVVEQDKEKTVPLPVVTKEQMELKKLLINDLSLIKTLTGEFSMSDDARDFYVDWYTRQDVLQKSGKLPTASQSPFLSGYCERRATHIKKIAMSISVSHSSKLIISLQDMERSLAFMEAAEKQMHRAFDKVSDSSYGEIIQLIMDKMVKAPNGRLKRSDVLREHFRDFDLDTIAMAEEALFQMKVMKVTKFIGASESGDVIYELIERDFVL